jgi:hypothetical protein
MKSRKAEELYCYFILTWDIFAVTLVGIQSFIWPYIHRLWRETRKAKTPKSIYMTRLFTINLFTIPCGGGVEYLHPSPASRGRRRKGKSRIWDSKIWSRIPRDSDPRMTALVRTSRNCKRQTHPLVRERAPHQQTRNCLTVIKILS